MEFLNLTFKELKDEIKGNLDDLNKQLQEAVEGFNESQREILLRGRIDPRVSEAENKRRELVRLEREFRERQLELQQEIATEREKLRFVNERANIEERIARMSREAANALRRAGASLEQAARAMERAIDRIRSFNPAAFNPQHPGPEFITVDLRLDGQTVTLERIPASQKHARIRGDINPTRLLRFNPVAR